MSICSRTQNECWWTSKRPFGVSWAKVFLLANRRIFQEFQDSNPFSTAIHPLERHFSGAPSVETQAQGRRFFQMWYIMLYRQVKNIQAADESRQVTKFGRSQNVAAWRRLRCGSWLFAFCKWCPWPAASLWQRFDCCDGYTRYSIYWCNSLLYVISVW